MSVCLFSKRSDCKTILWTKLIFEISTQDKSHICKLQKSVSIPRSTASFCICVLCTKIFVCIKSALKESCLIWFYFIQFCCLVTTLKTLKNLTKMNEPCSKHCKSGLNILCFSTPKKIHFSKQKIWKVCLPQIKFLFSTCWFKYFVFERILMSQTVEVCKIEVVLNLESDKNIRKWIHSS
jgi:hypothetical protein